jgi:hypothetical protein
LGEAQKHLAARVKEIHFEVHHEAFRCRGNLGQVHKARK